MDNIVIALVYGIGLGYTTPIVWGELWDAPRWGKALISLAWPIVAVVAGLEWLREQS